MCATYGCAPCPITSKYVVAQHSKTKKQYYSTLYKHVINTVYNVQSEEKNQTFIKYFYKLFLPTQADTDIYNFAHRITNMIINILSSEDALQVVPNYE